MASTETAKMAMPIEAEMLIRFFNFDGDMNALAFNKPKK